MTRITLIAAMVVGSLFASAAAFAQTAPTPPSAPALKTIGVPTSAKPQIVPSLIVMNSRGATLQGNKLTLNGVSPNSIIFADRPVRSAGHELTADLLNEWKSGSGSFSTDPPNATVSVLSKSGDLVHDAVVVLKSPKLEGEQLTFDVQVLEGNLSGANGPTSIFIDIIGLPRTPLSFAGVARRTAFRGAMYAGAAYGAAAAYGAYAPPPYYARPACGYYPYPPCY